MNRTYCFCFASGTDCPSWMHTCMACMNHTLASFQYLTWTFSYFLDLTCRMIKQTLMAASCFGKSANRLGTDVHELLHGRCDAWICSSICLASLFSFMVMLFIV
ncbi:hypothetical protein Dimus_000807 [Dionaea muscipula]